MRTKPGAELLTITETERYRKYGCDFRGTLVVVSYDELLKALLEHNPFGGGKTCDAIDIAREVAKERFPAAKELLAIPDLVLQR